MSTLRFKFTRGEELRFISHLDQQRLFHRAFRRANLYIEHSNGFNPHPRLSFALAMSVGLLSDSEYGDVVLVKPIDLIEFAKRLNKVLPKGLKITEVWEVPRKKDSLSASLTDSLYTVECGVNEGITSEKIKEILTKYLEKDEIPFEKRNKKGKRMLKNIRPFINTIEVIALKGEEATLSLSLKYVEQQSVKPELVLQTINSLVMPCFIIDPTIGIWRKELNLKK